MLEENQSTSNKWQQGNLIELEISDLSNSGDGVGRWQSRVVFVSNTVTGDRVLVRLIRVKPKYAYGKLETLLSASPHRIRPRCIVADKCGGCQWQHISDEYQAIVKHNIVVETLKRIGNFHQIEIKSTLTNKNTLDYRNKATYPLGYSPTGQIQAGYYRLNTHQIVNLNQCPVQDHRLNPLLASVKQDLQKFGLSIYNEKTHQGQLRHLSFRIGRHTGEILLTLVSTDWNLPKIQELAQLWMDRYSELVGVNLNYNPHSTNVIFGSQTQTIAGRNYLKENFAGLELRLLPDTFFQVNTEAAELLLKVMMEQLNLKGDEFLVDAYCGIGTFTLPLAQQVKEAVGIEIQEASVIQARLNAQINQIHNVTFMAGSVENTLPQLQHKPDLVLLDPPRKGCATSVIDTLLKIQPLKIVYISCQISTLARDLKLLCNKNNYRLQLVQPVDLFPQTAHIEIIAYLELITN